MSEVEFSPGRLGAGLLVLGTAWFAYGVVADRRLVYAGGGAASLGILLMAAFRENNESGEVNP